jgi:hypothetical protein
MKVLRWFVGQVTRLRRSVVGVLEPDAERGGRGDEHFTSADEPAAGPPEHWVARVRRGAPGLLEPSFRRRGEPAEPPVADRVVRSQTELELQPDSLEEPGRDYVPPEPPLRPRRRVAPVQAPLLRKVLRRERSIPPAEIDASPAPTTDNMHRELHAATRRASESADSPTGEPPDRGSPVGKTAAGQPERSTRRPEVVEFEAPSQRRTARSEPGASPDRPIRAAVTRRSAANGRQAELAVDEIGTDQVWERAVPPPAPKRESNVDRLPEPARPTSRQESSPEPGPRRPSRAEQLSAVDPHPWPELPPPLDQPDGDVEAALRAWEHQRRLDREQTRL